MTRGEHEHGEQRLRFLAREILALRAQGLHAAADAATRRRDEYARGLYEEARRAG
jgi:hypothetical protein